MSWCHIDITTRHLSPFCSFRASYRCSISLIFHSRSSSSSHTKREKRSNETSTSLLPPFLSLMATIIETIQKRNFFPTRPLKDDLPTFHVPLRSPSATITTVGSATSDHLIGLRKRLSSFSDKIQPLSTSSFARSRSVPSFNSFSINPLLQWWSWGIGWILSTKPPIMSDLELNEEEVAVLGTHNKGSLRHVLYRVQSGFRRLVMGSGTLPVSQKVRSDSFNSNIMGYAGKWDVWCQIWSSIAFEIQGKGNRVNVGIKIPFNLFIICFSRFFFLILCD